MHPVALRRILQTAACCCWRRRCLCPGRATIDKADTAWLLVSTLLVVMMTVPGLALFYGGLVRAKNILSVLMQVLVVASLAILLWIGYGYSLAFSGGNAWIGGLDKRFLAGVGIDSAIDTFTVGVAGAGTRLRRLPGRIRRDQLRAGGGRDRRTRAFRRGAAVHRVVVHLRLPADRAHGVGRQRFPVRQGRAGFRRRHRRAHQCRRGRTGRRVHAGPRIGFGRERLSPHSLPLTFTGAALLWVGWFGFNAGSALEANGVAALAFLNTLVAPAAAVLAWSALEAMLRGRASMLGAASGAVAGLVAITPACGTVGVGGAMAIGALGGVAGFWGVTALKRWLRADDSLDVFGIHGVCGIVGALLTGVFTAPSLGGNGNADYAMWSQLGVQALGIAITLAWSGGVALLAFHAAKATFGLRVAHEAEREGLDISSHGESAYDT